MVKYDILSNFMPGFFLPVLPKFHSTLDAIDHYFVANNGMPAFVQYSTVFIYPYVSGQAAKLRVRTSTRLVHHYAAIHQHLQAASAYENSVVLFPSTLH